MPKLEKKDTITAVHRLDLRKFLEGIGIWESLKAGDLRCGVCGAPVDEESLGCVYSEGGEVKVCCARPDCLAVVSSSAE